MTITAIETAYNGINYRSKLEACWAAFFDALQVRHEYELDAYALECGNYTPDFWLPNVEIRCGAWVEIKGQDPKSIEEKKCIELADAMGRKVVLIVGQPMRHVRARIGEENALIFEWNQPTRRVSNCFGLIAPHATPTMLHHAAVIAHQTVRWSPDITGKINTANKAWNKRSA